MENEWRYTIHFGQTEFVSFANLQKSTIKPLMSQGILPLTIKNLLTTTDVGKWISVKIKLIADKLFPSLSKNPNDWTDKISKFFKKVSEYLGPKTIAYIIAAVKNLTPKPSKEAIQAEMNKAEKIYKVVLVVLIAIAAFKLWIFVAPFFSALSAPAVSSALTSAAKTAGIWGFLGGTGNAVGLISKIKHLGHKEGSEVLQKGMQDAISNLKDELKSVSQEKPADSPFGDYYNTEESLRMQKLAGIL